MAMMERRPQAQTILLASGLGTTPFLLLNIVRAFSAKSSPDLFDLSYSEFAVVILAMGIALWLSSAAILTFSANLSRSRAWLFGLSASLICGLIATLIQPRLWSAFLRPFDGGPGYWLFVCGVLSAILTLAFNNRIKSRAARE